MVDEDPDTHHCAVAAICLHGTMANVLTVCGIDMASDDVTWVELQERMLQMLTRMCRLAQYMAAPGPATLDLAMRPGLFTLFF
jgi:hypothetical protein